MRTDLLLRLLESMLNVLIQFVHVDDLNENYRVDDNDDDDISLYHHQLLLLLLLLTFDHVFSMEMFLIDEN